MSMLRGIACVVGLTAGSAFAATSPDVATQVNDLADRFVSQVREKFPLRYAASGLPKAPRDTMDINSPAEVEAWRSFIAEVEQGARAIDTRSIDGKPEWVTLALLRQAIQQEHAYEICHSELWSVRSFGLQVYLAQVAELQPVDDADKRADILKRFGKMPAFVDQEIANLKLGVAQGFSSPRLVVERVLSDLDKMLSEPLAKGPYGSPAERAEDSFFRKAWNTALDRDVRPSLVRYRDYLRNDYLPKARVRPSITANRNGKECFRALVAANTSVNVDPDELFNRGKAHDEQEVQAALVAGKKRYGRDFANLAALAEATRDDPRNKFENEAQLREFILAAIRRGKLGTAKVVPVVPTVDVEARPASSDSAPSGQYFPRDEDGRPPIYYYRTDFQNLSPARLESTVLHEAWPGHHLQFEVSRANSKGSHPLAQLVYVPGLGEGWATYVEGLARELSLYDSELGVIGSVMDSMTPRMVADIGMHVRGWTEQQTLEYLVGRFPSTPLERVKLTVVAVSEEPGWMVPYALGAIEIENLREESRRVLGEKFDLRKFHQQIIEGGTVPFPALRSKLGLANEP